MSLHPHQHDYLVAELRKHAGSEREQTLALFQDANLSHPGRLRVPKAMLAVSFPKWSKWEKRSLKQRSRQVPVTDTYAAEFPSGVPGMPNTIEQADFDAAWQEAHS